MGQVYLIHSLTIMKEVKGRIHMGAIVGAHGKERQVIQVACPGRIHRLLFRLWIAGIDRAGKDFLADVIDFHLPSLPANLLK